MSVLVLNIFFYVALPLLLLGLECSVIGLGYEGRKEELKSSIEKTGYLIGFNYVCETDTPVEEVTNLLRGLK